MNKKLVTIALTGALFVLVSGFRGGCGHHRHHEVRADKIERRVMNEVDDALDDVDANQDQKRVIEAAARDITRKVLAEIGPHMKAKQAVHAEWESASPNKARVHEIIDQRIDAIRVIAHDAADAVLTVHSALTHEQRRELTEDWH
jgi:ABC-type transporter MlaC component